MNKDIIVKLSKLNILETTTLSDIEYKTRTNNDRYVYVDALDYGKTDYNYRRIDTKGLTGEEIDLLLKIDQTKNIRAIKNMAVFFVTLTVISIIVYIIGAVNIINFY